MIPESGENRSVDLYKANGSVFQWDHVCSILMMLLLLTVLLSFTMDYFWLFTTMVEFPGTSTCDELYLFYSTSLENGNWTPHPLNPVVRDIKS